jgi:hypothetical protein
MNSVLVGYGSMMGRRKTEKFFVSTKYSLGWGDNRDRLSSGHGAVTEDEAMKLARDSVIKMRRLGAASPIRSVEVTSSVQGRMKGGPVLFEASYFDTEQGLTVDEVYAARAHDWHALADRFNANMVRNNGNYQYGYLDWPSHWGPKPIQCPACEKALDGWAAEEPAVFHYPGGDLMRAARAGFAG